MSILLVAADPPSIEGLRDLLLEDRHTVVVQRQLTQSQSFNFDFVILDDTAASAATSIIWNSRLSDLRSATRSAPTIPFIWLASFPRISDWTAARENGAASMFSKPYNPIRIAEYIRDLVLSVD
jgi:DNA-binding NarL/FixJ family response regulator